MKNRGHDWGAIIPRIINRHARSPGGRLRPSPQFSSVDTLVLILSLSCSAFVMAAAMAFHTNSWMGWVGLLPLFLVIRLLAPFLALLGGAIWGGCLYVSLAHVFGGQTRSSLGSPVLLILLPGLYAYLGARLTRRIGFRPLFLAFGWLGLELGLRSLNLRHGLIATGQEGGGILRTLSGLFGSLFVVFVIAFFNAKLLSAVSDIQFRIFGAHFVDHADESGGWLLPRISASFSFLAAGPYRSRAPPLAEFSFN